MAEVVGVVLAGGRSSRMGRDKAFIALAGETLVARAVRRLAPQVSRLVINTNGDAAAFAGLGLPVVADDATGYQGPLAGIHAVMLWARANAPACRQVACVAVDTPFFPDDLVVRLQAEAERTGADLAVAARAESGSADAQKAVPMIAVAASRGFMHPTFGLYPVSLVPAIETFLAAGERRVQDFLARHEARPVTFPALASGAGSLDPFFNINTAAELKAAEPWLAE
jgi:molybdopterin-guanine dinucleotide biosynthesis protein A